MFPEDLSPFFNLAEFATLAVFELPEGGTREVIGIFDNAYFAPEVGETVLDSTQPRFTCPQSSLSGVERGCFVAIAGAHYSVKSLQPDGSGTAVVALHHEDSAP